MFGFDYPTNRIISRRVDLNEIVVFAKVVEAGSFVGASRALDVPTSTVSRRVAALEARLGARLLQRTTRKIHLTDAGRAYYAHAARVIAEVEAADSAVGRMQSEPRGKLRVTIPLNFGFLGPAVASYLARYPQVQVDIVSADRVVDLVHEGFDLAIRAGALADSSLVARSLGRLRSFVVASPAYVKKNGAPKRPEQLAERDALVFGAGAQRTTWRLTRGKDTVAVEVRPRVVVNDFDLIEAATSEGLGVALLPAFRSVSALRDKRLVRLVPKWCSTEIPLSAVYPSARYLSPTVKTFVDHLVEKLVPAPWEHGPMP